MKRWLRSVLGNQRHRRDTCGGAEKKPTKEAEVLRNQVSRNRFKGVSAPLPITPEASLYPLIAEISVV
jgi:hypothetical protein